MLDNLPVARAWRRGGLKPHRIERYTDFDAPDFENNVTTVIGRYVKPPQHRTVLCVDERPLSKALDRLDTVLPHRPNRAPSDVALSPTNKVPVQSARILAFATIP